MVTVDTSAILSEGRRQAKRAGRYARASALRELSRRIAGFATSSDIEVPPEYSLSAPSGAPGP